MKILIANGPNLNLLGIREKNIYGEQDFDQFLEKLRERMSVVELIYFQSNIEGELIDKIQEFGMDKQCIGIVLNAGGYAHTSVAIADAVKAVSINTISVHISNIFAREAIRHHDLLAAYSKGTISGLGLEGYALAVNYLLEMFHSQSA